ncbi:hypothetical protein [Lichenicola sp.]|uniref:hypothetical protein n=1 Tax=Lichenicola sp. TaxID=2804529 RepID=UPI003AFFFC33
MKPFISRLLKGGGESHLPAPRIEPRPDRFRDPRTTPASAAPDGVSTGSDGLEGAASGPGAGPSSGTGPSSGSSLSIGTEATVASSPGVQSILREIGPEWEFGRIVTVFAPVVLLELRRVHLPGQPPPAASRTYRILDRSGALIADALEHVPFHLLGQIRETMALAATGAATSAGVGSLDRFGRQFMALDRPFRLELMHRLFGLDGPPPLTLPGQPLAGDDTDRPRLAVDTSGGFVSLVVDGALEFPILLGGRPLDRFVEGWQPAALVTSFLPLLLIELKHTSGARACWVLDERLDRIDDAAFGQEQSIARIREVAPRLIRRHWLRVLELADDRPDPVVDPMFRLNGSALWRIFLICRDLVCPPIDDRALHEVREPLIIQAAGSQHGDLVLPPEALARAVSHDLADAGIAAIRSGRLVWPSPVDGSDAVLEAIIAPQEHSILYQFRDRTGLRFLVLSGDRRCRTIGLLFPSANLAIGALDRPDAWFRHATGADIWTVLMGQCIGHYDMVAHRRRQDGAEIVQVFMAPPLLHLGHYVWNDLPGQLALLEQVPDRLPRSMIIAGAAGQAELFGPVDLLLPEFAGKVDRTMRDTSAFVRWAYETNVVPIRFTAEHVSRALRDRVRAYTAGTEIFAGIAGRRAGHGAGRVIIIGLRLDDRTFVDQDAFHAVLLEHLARTSPGAIVVFDGRNAKPGGAAGETIAAMKDDRTSRPALEAELELVERLVQRFAGSGLEFVSTVGQSMQHSMSWCYHADVCVTVWGAGLAKYRWLANLPSLILTSRFNIEQRPDLEIYHLARWMQDPSIVVYPEPGFVTDHIDKVGLADSGMRVGRECFEVDPAHLRDQLDRLMALVGERDRNRMAAQLSA